jgi:hypothetical protein
MMFTHCPRLASPQKEIDGYCHENQILRFEAYFLPIEEDFETSNSFGHVLEENKEWGNGP